jgi:hypothetical protein
MAAVTPIELAQLAQSLVDACYYTACAVDMWGSQCRAEECSSANWAATTARDAEEANEHARRMLGSLLQAAEVFDPARAVDNALGWFWDRRAGRLVQLPVVIRIAVAPAGVTDDDVEF